ncbi:MAG: TIGR03905 family TSCPD domain-containing protein [Clostridiaceae bacterium]|nr:TIGR03905 family TSCPD domain-containing protein [Eubacteriales bacterium]
MHHTFYPEDVCSSRIDCDITDGRVYGLTFTNGCSGNLQAIGRLSEGRTVDELISLLSGIRCGSNATSCGDQLAKALAEALSNIKNAG